MFFNSPNLIDFGDYNSPKLIDFGEYNSLSWEENSNLCNHWLEIFIFLHFSYHWYEFFLSSRMPPQYPVPTYVAQYLSH